MTHPSEQVVQRIAGAFRARTLPEGDPVFLSHSSEVDMPAIEDLAHRSEWFDLPHDLLCANPLALAFATPAAFVWLLPAYLIASLTRYSAGETLTSTIVTCLTPPDEADAREFEALLDEIGALDPDALVEEDRAGAIGADDELLAQLMERVALLSSDEQAAVREYLEHIDAVHGADFPVLGPRQALERYWARPTGPAGNGS